ncbi:MAG: hypothetical protein GY793_03785, partial [Proteobacteria bacterium]|nr:hypothetical protein [Pseudomonadota bacterium]
MISYKEYLKACESKSEWEKDRSNIRSERAKVKEVFSLLSAPDNWVDHLKYGVRSISLKISIEREVVKRSSFY